MTGRAFTLLLALDCAACGAGTARPPGDDAEAHVNEPDGRETASADRALDGAADHARPPDPVTSVLVLYNMNMRQDDDGDGVQDSLQVARYYALRRGIPHTNILGLSCTNQLPQEFYHQYPAFFSEVLRPLRAKLAELGVESIDILAPVYGVPQVVNTTAYFSLDNLIAAPGVWDETGSNLGSGIPNPYAHTVGGPGFTPDMGHFSHAKFKLPGGPMYLVSRIDHPDGVARSLDLVDQALYGDAYLVGQDGYYRGTGYIDTSGGQPDGSPYTDAYLSASLEKSMGSWGFTTAQADAAMASAERFVESAGLPLKWENTTGGAVIGDTGARFSDGSSAARAPRAMLYGGWYNFSRYNDVWEWLPGSVACDLNSNSLSYGQNVFGVRALQRGATAVSGVVDEPFITGHPRPNILIYYLTKGYNYAEASTLATPRFGWKPLSIGDPLYAPFRDKPHVKDTQAPTLSAGFPIVSRGAQSVERVIRLLIDDADQPEVARVEIDYGETTAYGGRASSGAGYWRRHGILVGGLKPKTTYHYRVTLTDPVGNTSVSADLTFE